MCSTNLSSLASCLRQLESDKALERKKEASALKDFLTKKSIIDALDRNTDTKRKLENKPGENQTKLITWDTVFNRIKGFINIETRKLGPQTGPLNPKAAVVKRTCCMLFKLVIEKANSRGPQLKAKSILNMVLRVMEDISLRFLFGSEFTSVLLKQVLQVHSFMVQLPPSSLLKLFEVYVPYFSSPPSGWSKTVLHELLRLLLNVSKISTSHPKELVQLFEKIFSNIRHETPSNTHDGWLAALLTFCRKAAVSLQSYICDLGKKLLLPFLHFWNNRPTESAKAHLLEFFYIQLILHHPSGKWSVEDSAFTSDSADTWAVNIRELCETLLQDCDQVADRGTLTIGKDQQLRPELLCTLVEVCHLVFPTKYASVNSSSTFLTPSTWLNQTQSSSGVYPKRRRGVLHFSSLLEPLKNYKNPNGVLPWLQLISALLQKYPEVVDISDLLTLMETLQVIDLSTHQTEHRPPILRCWCAVVKAYAKNRSCATGTSANHTWKKLYDSMLRMIALNQCHEDSHALLCELIHYKLVTPQSDFYRLYLPGSNNYISESSLKTICMYLLNYSLPSKYTKQVSSTTPVTLTADSSISSESSGRHWFRYQLLQWVLNGDTADSLDSLRKSEAFLPLLAHFLLFLCVQNGNPSFLSYCTRNSLTVFPENWEWTKDLQHNLLKMSFDVPAENSLLENVNIMHTGTKCSRILQAVYDFLLSAVFFKAGLFRDSCQELSSCDIRNHICFIFHIMEASLFQGVMTADDLISSRLGETIMSLMKKLTDSVKNEKENALDTMKTLETLTSSNMYTEIPATISIAMTNSLASLIPDETFEFMLSLLTDYSQEYSTVVKSPSGSNLKASQLNGRSQIPSSTHHSHSSDDLMDMEDSFDIAEDCIEINSISDTIFFERRDGMQAYSPTHLKIASFLCKVFFNSVEGDRQREKIIKILNCEEKNLESPPHVHLLLHCLNILAEREPKYALDCIREVLKTHEVDLDGSWYIQCLSVLKLCVPYVASPSNPESQESGTRKTFFLILDTFWNREHQQQNDSKVSHTLVHLTVVVLQKLLAGGNCDSLLTSSSWATKSLKKLMSLLKSPDPEMCLTIANSFALLIEDLPQELHQTFFQDWYALIMGSDKANIVHKEDDARNSSLLTSLYHLSTLGGLIERQALFTFLQATRSKGISVSLLQKVFSLLSKRLGFSSSISMVQFHIYYLLSEWLNSGYPLVEFPFQILHCSTSSQFYRENTSLIVRILFDQLDVEAIKDLSKVIGRDWISILKESLPSIMSHFISWFAVPQDSCPEWIKKQKIATEGHKLLEQKLSSEVVQREITERLHELVIGILLLLHNENCPSVLKPLNLKLPPPNPTSFPPDVILNAFKYLIESKSGTLNNSLFSVLMETDHTLVNVMLSLRVHLFEATRIDEECRIVLVYQLLVELLIPDLSPVQHHSSFILRELLALSVTQLNRVSVNGARSSVRGLYVYLLTTVIEGTVDRLNEEIQCFLPKILDSLLVVLGEKPQLDSMVCRLLEIIFLEKHAFLVDTLKILDPLPKLPCLNRVYQQQQRIRGRPVTLDEALKKFWLSFKRTHGKPRVEGLEELLGHIQEKKSELNKMVEFFQSNHMYAEDLAKSPFHLVVSALIKLCTTGTDKIQQMCAKCLGEIGPVELGTPLLCPVDVLLEDTFDQELRGLEKCYLFIFKSLIDFLHDSRIEVVTASAGVLKNVLKTKTGQEFVLFCRAHKLRPLLKYLVPFSSRAKVKKPALLQTDVGNFSVLVDSFPLWVPNGGTHKEWLETLVCTLIDAGCSGYEIFPLLKPLCRVEVSFNEKFLPFLIHAILLSSRDQKIQEILSSQISNFFSKHCQLEKSSHSKESSQSSADQGNNADILVVQSRPSVQTVLNVIQYLRRQTQKQFTAPSRDCNYWLNVDYLDIAIAAQFCGQHFTALCYIELWRDNCNSPATSSQSSDSSSQEMFLNLLPLLSSRHSTYRAAVIQKILLKSYKQLGDKDGLYGCTMLFEDSLALQTSLFELDNRWDRILQVHDSGAATVATFSGPTTQENCGNILKALQKCGLNHTLQGYLMGVLLSSPAQQTPSTELLEFQCECAWRLGNWDLVLPEIESSHGVHQSLFKGLVCLPSKEFVNAQEELCVGRKQALMNMKLVSSKEQASYSLLLTLSDFRLFSLVQSALDFLQTEQDDHDGSLNKLLNIWYSVNKIPFHEFEFIEPSLCLQSVLLQQFASTFPSASSAFTSSLEQLLTLARQQGDLQVADQTLQRLLSVQTECGEQNLRWRVEAARNRWNRGEMASARQILKTLLKTLERQQEESCENASLYAETLMQLGQWQAESCFESPATILTDFLEKALHLLEPLQSQSKNCLWEGHLCVARYADLRFQEIRKHQQSQAFLLKKQIMKEAVEKAQKLRENRNPTDDPNSRKKAINTLLKQSEIDESEIKELEKEAEEMLIKAIKSYLCCLKGTDAHDLRAFRVIALWFQNCHDQQVCQLIEEEMASVQTYKFLPLIHQLAARMGTSDSAHFKRTLQKVIFRMCKEHPYHSMPVIMALCHADKDAPKSGNAGSRRQRSLDGNSQQARQETAKKIILKLKSWAPLQEYVRQLEFLCLAYIKLAYYVQESAGPIPDSCHLLENQYFNMVPVITEDIKVDKTLQYNSLVHVTGFDPMFKFVGGINSPKVITCQGSDGRKRQQLVKGQDDLRQDAVMQQVFTLVNRLLKKDPEALKRKLSIRTYKVVPLSSRSGVLQWCDGTIPIGIYLAGPSYKTGAHKIYNPKEITAAEGRQYLDLSKDKLSAYLEICKKFTPVFRYFFLENFPDPSVWYERRLAYTRSVSTCSIVGYILGLGDRHVQNILLDKRTAEVIHIDFGVAFEQGRILPTPETVPFRLTRDLVDGLGIAGVEGVFRRCCEKSMEVMRASQESLLTILEVLLYDPLYVWSISPQEAISHQRRQGQVSTDSSTARSPAIGQAQNIDNSRLSPDPSSGGPEVNKLAERVLLRLREKLLGVEDSVALSVPGQVSLLIQQAVDPRNLSKLFAGWQPHL